MASQQKFERNAAFVLIAAAALALFAANGPFSSAYDHLLHWKIGPDMPRFGRMSFHHWVADGLMAIFFLLVGLEVKREWYQGRLSSPAQRRLPIVAAVAGMAVPAAIFALVVGGEPGLLRGWAIPAATDIAFAIGVLAILGSRVPPSIKLLLVTIAIVDDVGAVLIIALFYTAGLNVVALGGALAVAGAMAALGQFGVRRLWPFMLGFAVLWLLMLASGVHATVAGVIAALTIPLGQGESHSPLHHLEHRIHPWVMFGIVPLFGFVSAGAPIPAEMAQILQPLPLAVLLGLFVGKQLGVFGAVWLAVRSGVAPHPEGATWRDLYGAATLCGIGFTMSLFIGELAFPADLARIDQARVGTLLGSLVSAVAGYFLLRPPAIAEPSEEELGQAHDIFGATHRH